MHNEPPDRAKALEIPIPGTAPLLVHEFNEKPKANMLASMHGRGAA